jgi:hypothetical protein
MADWTQGEGGSGGGAIIKSYQSGEKSNWSGTTTTFALSKAVNPENSIILIHFDGYGTGSTGVFAEGSSVTSTIDVQAAFANNGASLTLTKGYSSVLGKLTYNVIEFLDVENIQMIGGAIAIQPAPVNRTLVFSHIRQQSYACKYNAGYMSDTLYKITTNTAGDMITAVNIAYGIPQASCLSKFYFVTLKG